MQFSQENMTSLFADMKLTVDQEHNVITLKSKVGEAKFDLREFVTAFNGGMRCESLGKRITEGHQYTIKRNGTVLTMYREKKVLGGGFKPVDFVDLDPLSLEIQAGQLL